ncbi:lysophospholipid acyltransferase family protein [Neolewinella agarilytica]|uniref:1-acyl-sn-glycerol-3-phosphate acyltransferase/long-chain acyl-CoA synthetase n=1 Tax=Neolewinella agarilytica TaxID=478744 RepID=A0A1H9H955_9BACT|nr:lysophospholipid acyltransferase family protein [Neolewinella agarilytica]SEQ58855.1 1-acyl-sn-glycerol-3-phosphate acyltransferase/long-chain acyl-CoA synthetase [Neolewinella agarilytica]
MKVINRWIDSLVSNGMSYSSYLFFRTFCRGKIEGEAYILDRLDSNFILVSNHVSYLDWLVIWGVFKFRYKTDILFLAKEKLFNDRFWGRLMRYGNCIKVKDDGTKITDSRNMRTLLQENKVAIFPEGTRSRDGELQDFRPGAAVFSMRNQVDIIPVGLVGFFESWRPEERLPRPHRCSIRVGEPIASAELKAMGRGATDHLRETVGKLSGQL